MKIKSIFFDLDGTLINSSEGITYSIAKAISVVLPEFPLDKISASLIGPPVHEMFKQIFGSSDLDLIDNLTREFRKSYDSEGWKKTDLYQGVRETLIQLAGYNIRLFIVTNKPAKPAFRILDYFRVIHFFEDIVSPDTKDPPFTSKPAICQYVLIKHQLDEKHTILIGDSRDDAQAAKDCNLNFIAATYGYGKVYEYETLNHDCQISSFSELMKLIKN